nr:hypothetical protein [Tanacetum cinerariifolium]
VSLRPVVPKNYNPKGERFLIASRFPTPLIACAFFSPRATVKLKSRVCVGRSEDGGRCLPSAFLSAIAVEKKEEKGKKSLGGKKVIQWKCIVVQNVIGTGIDLPRSFPSHLGKLGLGDRV